MCSQVRQDSIQARGVGVTVCSSVSPWWQCDVTFLLRIITMESVVFNTNELRLGFHWVPGVGWRASLYVWNNASYTSKCSVLSEPRRWMFDKQGALRLLNGKVLETLRIGAVLAWVCYRGAGVVNIQSKYMKGLLQQSGYHNDAACET